jgi:hypothetical protein
MAGGPTRRGGPTPSTPASTCPPVRRKVTGDGTTTGVVLQPGPLSPLNPRAREQTALVGSVLSAPPTAGLPVSLLPHSVRVN